MAQREYTVEGRSFRTEIDYKRALRDKEIIDKLRARSAEYDEPTIFKRGLMPNAHAGNLRLTISDLPC